jgi:uncharacterized membrane protein YtjA (UPF0391 family)
MLGWTLIFLGVALVAGLLGFTGIAGTAAGIAKVLFFIFVILFVVSLFTGQSVPAWYDMTEAASARPVRALVFCACGIGSAFG